MLKIRTMATNFSPCKGSYVFNQFPSNVMFGMNGFHVSASGAIQGHHGPLVFIVPVHFNLYQAISTVKIARGRRLWKSTLDKEENTGNQDFLFYIQCFLPFRSNLQIF